MHYPIADARISISTNFSRSCKKNCENRLVVFELKWVEDENCAEIGQYSFIWHTGVLKRIGISQF